MVDITLIFMLPCGYNTPLKLTQDDYAIFSRNRGYVHLKYSRCCSFYMTPQLMEFIITIPALTDLFVPSSNHQLIFPNIYNNKNH